MALILSEDVLGRPKTVQGMIDILKRYESDTPIAYDYKESFTVSIVEIEPQEGEIHEYTGWIQIKED